MKPPPVSSDVQKRFSGRRVLVTGASGFIGEHLCRALQTLGADATGTDRKPRPGGLGVEWQLCDLANFNQTRRLVKLVAPDFVFHLASFVSGSRSAELMRPTFRANLMSTVNLLSSCEAAGRARIVLSNSMEEPEGDVRSCVASSPYAAAKLASSIYGRTYHALYGVRVSIARIFMVYGPAQKDLSKLVPYVALSALRGEAPKLTSGKRRVDWIYVEDVVRGLLALAAAEGVDGRTVDIGTGKTHSVGEVAEMVCKVADCGVRPEFGSVKDRAMEQERVADAPGTRKAIGWRSSIPFREGIARTVAWYRSSVTG